MSESVRRIAPGDEARLISLWQRVFGDSPELIAEFLRLLPGLGQGFCAGGNGELAGAAYLLTDLRYQNGTERRGVAYLYAVAVEERFRRRGIGAALVKAAAEYARERELIFSTQPAEESLFAWYRELTGMEKLLCRDCRRISPGTPFPLRVLSAEEYSAERERLLADIPHVRLGAAAMQYEEALCRSSGGGLYAFPGGIAAAVSEGETVVIKEILSSSPETDAAALTASLDVPSALCCFPCASGQSFVLSDFSFPESCHWNLTFD